MIALIAIGKRLIRLVKGHSTWDDAVAIFLALAVLSLPASLFLIRYLSPPAAEAVRAYLLGLSKGTLEGIVASYLILAVLIPVYLDVEKEEKGSALGKLLKALGKPLVNIFGILCLIYLVLVVPAVFIFYPPGPLQVYVMAGVVGLAILPVVVTFFLAPDLKVGAGALFGTALVVFMCLYPAQIATWVTHQFPGKMGFPPIPTACAPKTYVSPVIGLNWTPANRLRREFQILVDTRRSVTNTGVYLQSGQICDILARGVVRLALDSRPGYPPDGDPRNCLQGIISVPFTAPELRCHSLVGRIGSSGKWFQVGSRRRFVARTSGRLYLGANDNIFSDNSGAWQVVIAIE